MATYKPRGNSHNVIYPYKDENRKDKQQWETYETELEAIHRKANIDYLQKNKMHEELYKAVIEYKKKRTIERAEKEAAAKAAEGIEVAAPARCDNTHKTYGEFVEKWFPYYAHKQLFSPNTYDGYKRDLKNHILPYFGSKVMSMITAEDADDFLDYLSKKPCLDNKRYGRKAAAEPKTLSSATVKKCFNILKAGFSVAKQWRYVTEIPEIKAPAEKNKKRNFWSPTQVQCALEEMKEDKLIYLAVHLGFVCSLRAGETVGISIKSIDLHDRSMWIKQEVQRVSDEALAKLPGNEVLFVFPKQIESSKSSMILKGPKTDGSTRKQYLTTPLLMEIKERIEEINRCKEIFGKEYHDYDLLICHPDGRPIEPKSLNREFKSRQDKMQIDSDGQLEFQGLRKSGQMHKVRLSSNNYQLVAESSGQSPEVLMSNYNEALESEKRTLSLLVETSFYPNTQSVEDSSGGEIEKILQEVKNNPELSRQILQLLLSGAVSVA